MTVKTLSDDSLITIIFKSNNTEEKGSYNILTLLYFSKLLDELFNIEYDADINKNPTSNLEGNLIIPFKKSVFNRYLRIIKQRSIFNADITACTLIFYNLEKYLQIYHPFINLDYLYDTYSMPKKIENFIDDLEWENFETLIDLPTKWDNIIYTNSNSIAEKIITHVPDLNLSEKLYKNYGLFLLEYILNIEDVEKQRNSIIKYKILCKKYPNIHFHYKSEELITKLINLTKEDKDTLLLYNILCGSGKIVSIDQAALLYSFLQ